MGERRKYETTLARIAGNIAPSLLQLYSRWEIRGGPADGGQTVRAAIDVDVVAEQAVRMARAIVDEVIRTEPAAAREAHLG